MAKLRGQNVNFWFFRYGYLPYFFMAAVSFFDFDQISTQPESAMGLRQSSRPNAHDLGRKRYASHGKSDGARCCRGWPRGHGRAVVFGNAGGERIRLARLTRNENTGSHATRRWRCTFSALGRNESHWPLRVIKTTVQLRPLCQSRWQRCKGAHAQTRRFPHTLLRSITRQSQ